MVFIPELIGSSLTSSLGLSPDLGSKGFQIRYEGGGLFMA